MVVRFADAAESGLRERVAGALINKAITLDHVGRSDEALAVYDEVVTRFADATESGIREHIAEALRRAARAKLEAGDVGEAEVDLRRSLKYAPKRASIWNSLGNLLLDNKGDPAAAELAYREGLLLVGVDNDRAVLNANSAYLQALFVRDHHRAREHIQLALANDGEGITASGRALLSALPISDDVGKAGWGDVFNAIGRAVDSGDTELWVAYLDDLQRLLWFVIAHDGGDALLAWMQSADYVLRQAPLYHAAVAAISGEDHLLTINPETRAPSERIYEGIARRLKLYASWPKHQTGVNRTS